MAVACHSGLRSTGRDGTCSYGSGGSYREEWSRKRESDQKNTMVFNFVNSKKEVSHIENDGLDLSKRGSKGKGGKAHIRQLAKVSQTSPQYLIAKTLRFRLFKAFFSFEQFC